MSAAPLIDDQWESALYTGFVRHRRFSPRYHEFNYPLFMWLLKLDEIADLSKHFWQFSEQRFNWVRFKRDDYLGEQHVPLADAVKLKIAEKLGTPDKAVEGDVYFLGNLRYLGFYFSPLNLYFLKQQQQFRYMLAEVSNTPWLERHYYLIDLANVQPHEKTFHVSPFNPMDQVYHWRITPPEKSKTKSMVHLETYQQQTDQKVFDATLVLKRKPLNQSQLNRVLIRKPAQTASIVAGIHWQALKLFVKRVPLYPHPEKHRQENIKV